MTFTPSYVQFSHPAPPTQGFFTAFSLSGQYRCSSLRVNVPLHSTPEDVLLALTKNEWIEQDKGWHHVLILLNRESKTHIIFLVVDQGDMERKEYIREVLGMGTRLPRNEN
jgi:hypothetical protein